MTSETLLKRWISFKAKVGKNPYLWSLGIFTSFFIIKLLLWNSVPNEIPLVSTAIAIISLSVGVRYGLLFSVPAFISEFFFFTPESYSTQLTSPIVILNLTAYAVVLVFIVLSFGAQHAIEAEMDRVLKKQNEWINIASHELKTPINGIIGISRLLKKNIEAQSSNSNLKHINLIEKSTWHLNKIVSNLLDLSKLSVEQSDSFENFSVLDELQDVCDLMNIYALEKGLHLKLQTFGCNIFVRGDQVKFQQILINLIENAIKYTFSGEIIIECNSVYKNGSYDVLVKVRDTGPGIAESDMKQIFLPFYRVNKSQNQISGSGLGLAICKRVIQQLGGEIGVHSTVGKGTEFWVQLPFQDAGFNHFISANKNFQINSETKIRALIAEDNAINKFIILKELEELNIEAVVVSNGEEAFKLSTQNQFDFILLDCQMPILSGFEAAQKIRLYFKKNKKLVPPIVGFTADTTEECRLRAISSGMDFLIYKPFHVNELKELLVEILPNKKVSFEKEIENIFLNELPRRRDELLVSMNLKNWEDVKKKTHYLRSSLLALNQTSAAEVCRSIEADCDKQDFDRVTNQIKVLNALLLEFDKNLQTKDESASIC